MIEKLTFESLAEFVEHGMRMSHVYQPVMLRTLLENGGQASVEAIAKALLSYDRSQVEYYELRTKNMVGKVLAQNGIVVAVRQGQRIVGYRIASSQLGKQERQALIGLCNDRLEAYLAKRGDAIWDHRGNADGYVPGSIRYEVLKRAKRRCELCGAHEENAALHVDHIIPRAKGGADDLSNFQALCMTCNTNKRDRDDTDFRGVLASYDERENGCVFCALPSDRVVDDDELCFAIRDAFAVTPLHTLVIPKRHVADYFDLYQPELNAIHRMLERQRQEILDQDTSVAGFNVGANAGRSAGQTVFHVHVHLIPRRNGDVEEPRGGVRGVIPARQSY